MANSQPRYVYLDLARGIGSLCVVAWHVCGDGRISEFSFINLHYLVVDFFFVLSGIVLFPGIQRVFQAPQSSRQDYKFLWQRFLRLWPLTVAVLAVSLVVEIAVYLYEQTSGVAGPEPAFSVRPIWAWFFALGFGQLTIWASWVWSPPLWSLAALWWATVVTILGQRIRKFDVAWVCLATGILLELMCFEFNGEAISQGQAYFGWIGFARALVGFNAGLLIRKYLLSPGNGRSFPNFVYFALLIPFTFLIDSHFHEQTVILAPLIWLPLILALANLETSKLSRHTTNIITTIGKYSFPIFVWHVIVLRMCFYSQKIFGYKIDTDVFWGSLMLYLQVVLVTVLISALTMKFVEPRIVIVLERIGGKHLPFLRRKIDAQVL